MSEKKSFDYQPQKPPGVQSAMRPIPESILPSYKGSEKLKGKVALITGGDSGIGRAVAVHFAREGCDVLITYYDDMEEPDAKDTRKMCEAEGVRCEYLKGDLSDKSFAAKIVDETIGRLGKLNIIVLNSAQQVSHDDVADMDMETVNRVFQVNVISQFATIIHTLKLRKLDPNKVLPAGQSSIILTSSINAFRGHEYLIDYTGTKAAQLGLMRSLTKPLIKLGIRVNAVAPGPIWTPLIPATMGEHMTEFGLSVPMERAGHPSELGPTYVFLACEDMSSYIAGQTIHVNGGVCLNC